MSRGTALEWNASTMAKHRLVRPRAQTTRQYGLEWRLEGERLTHSSTELSPRLACVAKRFEHRGLVVDSRARQISIPRGVEAKKRGRIYMLGVVVLPIIVVPFLVVDEPAQVQKRAPKCVIQVGGIVPPKAMISRRVALGGLSVLTLSCAGKRYSVTIDAKGAIVDSKYL